MGNASASMRLCVKSPATYRLLSSASTGMFSISSTSTRSRCSSNTSPYFLPQTSFSSSAANARSRVAFVSEPADFSRYARISATSATSLSRRALDRLPTGETPALPVFAPFAFFAAKSFFAIAIPPARNIATKHIVNLFMFAPFLFSCRVVWMRSPPTAFPTAHHALDATRKSRHKSRTNENLSLCP